jgi:hypothetical protein
VKPAEAAENGGNNQKHQDEKTLGHLDSASISAAGGS